MPDQPDEAAPASDEDDVAPPAFTPDDPPMFDSSEEAEEARVAALESFMHDGPPVGGAATGEDE